MHELPSRKHKTTSSIDTSGLEQHNRGNRCVGFDCIALEDSG